MIRGGGLTVIDPNSGNPFSVLKLEPLQDGSGRIQMVQYLFRDDGTLADLSKVPGHTFEQALRFDRAGNIVVADDTTSGAGLAKPHIPSGGLQDTNVTTWPATNATSFTTIAGTQMEI